MTLNKFKHAVIKPLPESILQQPEVTQSIPLDKDETEVCHSTELKNRRKKQKSVIKMARKVLVRKCGILAQDKESENMTLQQYLDNYKKPLSISTKQAIKSVSEITKFKKVKKKKKRGTKADVAPPKTKKPTVQAVVLEA